MDGFGPVPNAKILPNADLQTTFDTFNVTLKWKAVSPSADVAESGMYLYLRVRLAAQGATLSQPLPPDVQMLTIVGSGSTPHTAALTDESGRANLVLSLWVAKLLPHLTRGTKDSVDNYQYAVKGNVLMMRSDTKPHGVVRDHMSSMAMVARAEVTLGATLPNSVPFRVIYALQRRIEVMNQHPHVDQQARRQAQASYSRSTAQYRPPPTSRQTSTAAGSSATSSYQNQAAAVKAGPASLDKNDPDAVYKYVYVHDEPDLLKMDTVWSVPISHEDDPRSYIHTRVLPGSTYPKYLTWVPPPDPDEVDEEHVEPVDPRALAAARRVAEFNSGLENLRVEMVSWRKTEMIEENRDPDANGNQDEDSDDDSME